MRCGCGVGGGDIYGGGMGAVWARWGGTGVQSVVVEVGQKLGVEGRGIYGRGG